jgi:tetratricopeptide (TPR) repeat protein
MPKKGSEIDAKAGEIRLSLKNAAPGTCFAAFGVFMIVVMLIQGNPEKKVIKTQTKEVISQEVTWRSDDEIILTAMTRGRKLEQAGEFKEAIKAYVDPLKNGDLSLKEVVGLLRAISTVYLKQNRQDEAYAYASFAYQVDPSNAEGLVLIARIQFHRGKNDEAIKAISEAARIDPSFIIERDQMKEKMKP